MSRALFLFPILLFALSTPPPGCLDLPVTAGVGLDSAAHAESDLTVVSLNVARETRVDRILTDMRNSPMFPDADVWLLQEAMSNVPQVAEALGMHYVSTPADDLGDGVFSGLAILSRYPLKEHELIRLPRFDLRFRTRCRVGLTATALRETGSIRLFNVHLDTRITQQQRLEQVRPVLDAARGSEMPAVVGGDFNTANIRWLGNVVPIPYGQNHAAALQTLFVSHGFESPLADAPGTFHLAGIPLKLDWIFHTGFETVASGVEDIPFSDHEAVWTSMTESEDWPEFRGPTGQGHSTEKGVPVEWSEYRNIKWKTPVAGLGWSSPVVAGGKVWLTTAIDEKDTAALRALAFDIESGREVINTEIFRLRNPREISPKNSFASPTPIIEGDRVYVHFGQDGTAALTTAGEIVWKTRLPYESQHGGGGSPALFGDLLIINCDGADEAYVVALDKSTGKQKWKSRRRQPWDQSYSTPLAVRVGDQDQIISIGAYRTVAYEPETGKEIWRVGYSDGFSNVPRPVFGHGLVYIATGFQEPSLMAVRVDGKGDVTKSHVAWTLERGAPHTPSPILIGDELYIVNDLGIATCVDAKSGRIHWQQRLPGGHSASPVFVDGRIYFLSENGVTTVIQPGKEFRRIASNSLDGATLASMAVAQQSFFIRSDTHLYRIRM